MPATKKDESRAQSADSPKACRKPSSDSGHLQKVRHETKILYMNSEKALCKEPELTTLISEVCGGTNIQSKLAFCNVTRNRRLRLSPRSQSAGVATDFFPPT